MLRFIVWLIILYISAKIVGEVIRVVRRLNKPKDDVRSQQPSPKPPSSYGDVQDADYEDISDKP